jgi:hypothetical protein
MNPSDAGEGNYLPVGYAVRGVEDQAPFDGVDGFDGALGLQKAAAVLAVVGFKIQHGNFGVLLFLRQIQKQAQLTVQHFDVAFGERRLRVGQTCFFGDHFVIADQRGEGGELRGAVVKRHGLAVRGFVVQKCNNVRVFFLCVFHIERITSFRFVTADLSVALDGRCAFLKVHSLEEGVLAVSALNVQCRPL